MTDHHHETAFAPSPTAPRSATALRRAALCLLVALTAFPACGGEGGVGGSGSEAKSDLTDAVSNGTPSFLVETLDQCGRSLGLLTPMLDPALSCGCAPDATTCQAGPCPEGTVCDALHGFRCRGVATTAPDPVDGVCPRGYKLDATDPADPTCWLSAPRYCAFDSDCPRGAYCSLADGGICAVDCLQEDVCGGDGPCCPAGATCGCDGRCHGLEESDNAAAIDPPTLPSLRVVPSGLELTAPIAAPEQGPQPRPLLAYLGRIEVGATHPLWAYAGRGALVSCAGSMEAVPADDSYANACRIEAAGMPGTPAVFWVGADPSTADFDDAGGVSTGVEVRVAGVNHTAVVAMASVGWDVPIAPLSASLALSWGGSMSGDGHQIGATGSNIPVLDKSSEALGLVPGGGLNHSQDEKDEALRAGMDSSTSQLQSEELGRLSGTYTGLIWRTGLSLSGDAVAPRFGDSSVHELRGDFTIPIRAVAFAYPAGGPQGEPGVKLGFLDATAALSASGELGVIYLGNPTSPIGAEAKADSFANDAYLAPEFELACPQPTATPGVAIGECSGRLHGGAFFPDVTPWLLWGTFAAELMRYSGPGELGEGGAMQWSFFLTKESSSTEGYWSDTHIRLDDEGELPWVKELGDALRYEGRDAFGEHSFSEPLHWCAHTWLSASTGEVPWRAACAESIHHFMHNRGAPKPTPLGTEGFCDAALGHLLDVHSEKLPEGDVRDAFLAGHFLCLDSPETPWNCRHPSCDSRFATRFSWTDAEGTEREFEGQWCRFDGAAKLFPLGAPAEALDWRARQALSCSNQALAMTRGTEPEAMAGLRFATDAETDKRGDLLLTSDAAPEPFAPPGTGFLGFGQSAWPATNLDEIRLCYADLLDSPVFLQGEPGAAFDNEGCVSIAGMYASLASLTENKGTPAARLLLQRRLQQWFLLSQALSARLGLLAGAAFTGEEEEIAWLGAGATEHIDALSLYARVAEAEVALWSLPLQPAVLATLAATTSVELANPDYRPEAARLAGDSASFATTEDPAKGLTLSMFLALSNTYQVLGGYAEAIGREVPWLDCSQDAPTRRTEHLRRLGHLMRLSGLAEDLARDLRARTAGQAGSPMPAWVNRLKPAQTALEEEKLRFHKHLYQTLLCQFTWLDQAEPVDPPNSYFPEPYSVPPYFPSAGSDDATYFAISDYLVHQWAVPAVEAADRALERHRAAALALLARKPVEESLEVALERQEEEIRRNADATVARLCGFEPEDRAYLPSGSAGGGEDYAPGYYRALLEKAPKRLPGADASTEQLQGMLSPWATCFMPQFGTTKVVLPEGIDFDEHGVRTVDQVDTAFLEEHGLTCGEVHQRLFQATKELPQKEEVCVPPSLDEINAVRKGLCRVAIALEARRKHGEYVPPAEHQRNNAVLYASPPPRDPPYCHGASMGREHGAASPRVDLYGQRYDIPLIATGLWDFTKPFKLWEAWPPAPGPNADNRQQARRAASIVHRALLDDVRAWRISHGDRAEDNLWDEYRFKGVSSDAKHVSFTTLNAFGVDTFWADGECATRVTLSGQGGKEDGLGGVLYEGLEVFDFEALKPLVGAMHSAQVFERLQEYHGAFLDSSWHLVRYCAENKGYDFCFNTDDEADGACLAMYRVLLDLDEWHSWCDDYVEANPIPWDPDVSHFHFDLDAFSPSALAPCYRGQIGHQYLQMASARQAVRVAQASLSALTSSIKIHAQLCMRTSQNDALEREAFAKYNAAMSALDKQAAAVGAASFAMAGAMAAMGGGSVAGVAGSLLSQASAGIRRRRQAAEAEYQGLTLRIAQEEEQMACWADVAKLKARLDVEVASVAQALIGASAAAVALENLVAEGQRGLELADQLIEAETAVCEEHDEMCVEEDRQGRGERVRSAEESVTDNLEVACRTARREWFEAASFAAEMLDLSAKAAVYELQGEPERKYSLLWKTEFVRNRLEARKNHAGGEDCGAGAFVDFDLDDLLNRIKAATAGRTVAGARPERHVAVFSLRDDLLNVDDRLGDGGERPRSAVDGLRETLTDPRSSVYGEDGEYLGQAVRLSIAPDGELAYRCGERIAGVGLAIEGDMLNAASPAPPVFLLQRNTFGSQKCGAAGVAGARIQPTINAVAAAAAWLDVTPFAKPAGLDQWSWAMVHAPLNPSRKDLYLPHYPYDASGELTYRGLYGEYVLLIPWEGFLDQGVRLDRVEDIVFRFELLSLNNGDRVVTMPNEGVAGWEPGGLVDDGGFCVRDSACASGHCVESTCCEVAFCDSCHSCASGSCAPLEDGALPRYGVVAGYRCDGQGRLYTSCTEESGASVCAPGWRCIRGVCRETKDLGADCQVDLDCARGFCVAGVCCNSSCLLPCATCETGVCQSRDVGDDAGEACGAYRCAEAGQCYRECRSATWREQCRHNHVCVFDDPDLPERGQCRPPKANGEPCAEAYECASGHCVDGVCCNYECAGACESCSTDTAVGTCTPFPLGDAGRGECGDFACSGGAGCFEDCSVELEDKHCASGSICIAGACVLRRGLGESCSREEECASGHCTEVIQHVAGGDYDRHDVEPWVDGGQAWKMDVRETTAIAAGPDDTLYFARGEVIGRIDPEHGSGHTIMELGTEQHACSFFKSNPRDARRAGDLWVGFVLGMAADGDGNLYLSDASCATVYRVAAGDDGRVDGDDPITLVAGTPNWLGEFDANLVHPDNALLQRLEYPRDLAVGADGALYIATNNQVLRLDLDTRTLSALTARNTTGLARCPGRHRTAAEVVISQPYGLAAGPTALFVASHDGNAVLKVGYPDGLGLDVTRVLGNCEKSSVTPDTVGDALAADLPITHPIALAAGPDESLFVLDRYSARMWRIDEDGALSSEVGGGTTRHTRGRPEDTKVDGRGALVAVDSSGDLVYYDNAHPWPTEAWKVDAHLRRLGGVCAVPIDSADGCVQDSDCGDGQQCTTDTCDLVHGCQYDPRPGPCDDGIDCTLDDICVAGLCQPGEWAVCDDGNPCTDDACDSAQGCTHTPAIGGCDDGDPCTTGDTCLNGWCAPGTGPDCMSSDCSSRPACEPLQDFGPMCAYGEPTAEIACAEMCAEALSCPQVSHTDDQESCRLDCEEIALALAPGAIDAWERCVFGESCDDIFAGAVLPDAGPLDACLTRAMETPEALAESQVVCAALVDRYGQCEAPSDEVEAFSQLCQGFYWLLRYEARTALGECVDMELSCEEARRRFDEVTCELLDVFIPSGDDGPYESAPPPWECEPEGTGPQCDDGNPCTNDLCAGGQCTHEPANGAACDDGDPCTESDSCGAGGCYGLPLSCDDGDDCTHDFCYPDEGCVHTPDQSPGCSGGGGE